QDVQHEQIRISERLRGVEAQAHGPRSAEALKALEVALGNVASKLHENQGVIQATIAERLEDAENRTSGALRDLQASFATLDSRLNTVESAGASGAEARLEELAATLSSRVDAARAEMIERMRVTADTRFDRMERALSEMSEHVRAAEDRSTAAIEHMGREVVAIAESLGRRVQTVEERGAEAIEQVSGEVGRIAHVVESRLGKADTAQAQALEKLGQEISRITERLGERISNSERRAAQAIDEVGEQVARVTERISQRHERASSDLADRIQQSEERTAKLLEEAREKLERLGAGHPAEEPTAPAPDQALVSEYPGFEATPAVFEPIRGGRVFRRALGARFAGAVALAPQYEDDTRHAAELDAEPITAFRPRPVETIAYSPADLDADDAVVAAGVEYEAPQAESLTDDQELARLDLELDAAIEAGAETEREETELQAETDHLEAEAEVEAAGDERADEAFFDADEDEPTPEAVLQAVAAEPVSFAAVEAHDDDEAEIDAETASLPQPGRPLTTREVVSRARAAARLDAAPRRRDAAETSSLFAARYSRTQKQGV
ncbi:MAG TPA: hypothetical protein VFE03_09685, partial [Caulobacteraceae bacterium]|nr:hypothetical protein [Caulobacteraceae bacterium]